MTKRPRVLGFLRPQIDVSVKYDRRGLVRELLGAGEMSIRTCVIASCLLACDGSARETTVRPDVPPAPICELAMDRRCNEGDPFREWCDYPDDRCGLGSASGSCQLQPQDCVGEGSAGACGCDGKMYANACLAQQAGVDVGPMERCGR